MERGVIMYHFLLTCLGILLLFCFPRSGWCLSYANDELSSGYITIIDEENTVIFQTGLTIHTGDQYINEDNNLYEITLVEDTLAKARYINPQTSISFEQVAIPVQGGVAHCPNLLLPSITHIQMSHIFLPMGHQRWLVKAVSC